MGSISRPDLTNVTLIPWDPDSPEHAERMIQQRIACGWKQDAVPKWKDQQREGEKILQWVVIDQSNPNYEEYVSKHITAYPKESTALSDTATSLGGQTRQSNPSVEFVPVGHISLNTDYESQDHNTLKDSTPGVYFIADLFISKALQGLGFGGAAMDIVEKTAISEPLCAKVLALSTPNKDDPNRVARHVALKNDLPKITNQEWYERRGYEVYDYIENMWSEDDETGKTWWVPGVFMKKHIS